MATKLTDNICIGSCADNSEIGYQSICIGTFTGPIVFGLPSICIGSCADTKLSDAPNAENDDFVPELSDIPDV